MKRDIFARIKERNNDKIDTYLGLGYTINFMDMERDYVYQFYLFGVVGIVLFICPYFIIILYLIINMLKKYKYYFNYATYFLLLSPFLGLVIAYLSGHVFGWVSPMMWLAITISILDYYVSVKGKEVE